MSILDLDRKIRWCILVRRVRSLREDIRREFRILYHGGRLDIDRLMEDYSREKSSQIWRIKRHLIRLRRKET